MMKKPEFKSVTVVKYQEGRVVCGLVRLVLTWTAHTVPW
jgi:hypothetical protein